MIGNNFNSKLNLKNRHHRIVNLNSQEIIGHDTNLVIFNNHSFMKKTNSKKLKEVKNIIWPMINSYKEKIWIELH